MAGLEYQMQASMLPPNGHYEVRSRRKDDVLVWGCCIALFPA
uniref:Uncharacterized protein n=1 Tax=Moniliophthora roreri TaxID=221103 RepID=A0A0W0FIW9_MONRR